MKIEKHDGSQDIMTKIPSEDYQNVNSHTTSCAIVSFNHKRQQSLVSSAIEDTLRKCLFSTNRMAVEDMPPFCLGHNNLGLALKNLVKRQQTDFSHCV